MIAHTVIKALLSAFGESLQLEVTADHRLKTWDAVRMKPREASTSLRAVASVMSRPAMALVKLHDASMVLVKSPSSTS